MSRSKLCLAIAQTSGLSAQPKQPPSISSPSLPKSTDQVSQFQSSVHLSQSVEPNAIVNVEQSDSHFPVQPSFPKTVQPFALSNSSVPAAVEQSVSEMESTSLTLAVQPGYPLALKLIRILSL